MPEGLEAKHEPLIPDDAEAQVARTAAERLRELAAGNGDVRIRIEGDDAPATLPARAVAILHDVLVAMAERTPVSVVPHEAELTTQQAADYLNVSRPFVTRQIDAGNLRHRMVGTHRRIRFADLLAFEETLKRSQKDAMRRLNEEAERLGLE